MKLTSATFILLFTVFCFVCEKPSALAVAPMPTQDERLLQQIQKLNDPPQRYLKLPELPFIKQTPSTTSPVRTASQNQQSTVTRLAQKSSTTQEKSQIEQKEQQSKDPPSSFSEGPSEQVSKKTSQQQIQLRKLFTRRASKRRDPYSIVAAARQKHSPLQGRSVSFGKPAIGPQVKQWTEQISSTKQQLASGIKQQPKQIREVLAIATADFQKQSTQKLKNHANNIHTLFQEKIKAPLRNLFKKIEDAAHETVVRLQ